VRFEEHLSHARAALQQGRWTEARAGFEASLGLQETAEALEGLAQAYWWLCDARSSVRYRERAWVLFRQAGEPVRAGRAAIDLSISYLVNLGNDSAARGWLARAERLTRSLEPNPLQGWLLLMEGYMSGDAERALACIERALHLGQETSDADLELVALSDLGIALVVVGRAGEGLAMLDEAMAAALGGECSRLDTVVFAMCNMLAACHLVGDLDRATQWCKVAEDFMSSYGCPFLYARCRTHYGGVLVAKGRWEQAEDQLRAALEMSEDAGPGPRVEALGQLADLRLRQGRLEEAEALLALVDDSSGVALPAAAVRLARGEAGVAAKLLERRARALGDNHIEVVPILALLVEALLADGDLQAATEAESRLHAAAKTQDRGPAAALAVLASAHLAVVTGHRRDASRALEQALGKFSALDLPLETARVRLELARLMADEHPDSAIAEAQVALGAFERLGATADRDGASGLLRALGVRPRSGSKRRSLPALTDREREVLDLLGLGLSNPEIAARLYISRKTASHHVSNVLSKLGVRNRAEAVAYAARHGASSNPSSGGRTSAIP
jgi:DNA-binding CsgD family transcriptional regulator